MMVVVSLKAQSSSLVPDILFTIYILFEFKFPVVKIQACCLKIKTFIRETNTMHAKCFFFLLELTAWFYYTTTVILDLYLTGLLVVI